MFEQGDLVVHGSLGVCRIEETTTLNIPGIDGNRPYYRLRPLYLECRIFVPVDNTGAVIRPVISEQEAVGLIDWIPTVKAETHTGIKSSQRAEFYESYFRTRDCRDLIRLTMILRAKKRMFVENKRSVGALDEKYMRRAEELLFGEMAAALGIGRDEVPAYIAGRVGVLQ